MREEKSGRGGVCAVASKSGAARLGAHSRSFWQPQERTVAITS